MCVCIYIYADVYMSVNVCRSMAMLFIIPVKNASFSRHLLLQLRHCQIPWCHPRELVPELETPIICT